MTFGLALDTDVSTHSRPKAAGCPPHCPLSRLGCFNTQPPEGGWARGIDVYYYDAIVSTHSRPKAAGIKLPSEFSHKWFQHTAARRRLVQSLCRLARQLAVSTHSRPKAAGAFG